MLHRIIFSAYAVLCTHILARAENAHSVFVKAVVPVAAVLFQQSVIRFYHLSVASKVIPARLRITAYHPFLCIEPLVLCHASPVFKVIGSAVNSPLSRHHHAVGIGIVTVV